LKIRQFFYNSDNLGYLVFTERRAMAIDGGACDDILAFVQARELSLEAVTHTHGHGDHTTGTRQLAESAGARHLDHRRFTDGQRLDLDGEALTVRLTPGHTADSVSFAGDGWLVTGDTLFNGTVGNCFSGDLKAFYRSIRLLTAYPATTRIYAGHDYVNESLAFARQLTPGNSAIDAYARKYDPAHVVSTLEDELSVNPYLRYNAPEIVSLLASRGLPTETDYQRWEGIMSIG
jgi:hydroxyacylglutathione hydrolase